MKSLCRCCEGLDILTPVAVFNRPGLDALLYRAGTHGSFFETMKARLSSSEFPKLAGLTTRDGGDASIALLDAWATVAGVLTFYQERIANEGYLRTAVERRSILELARLIGYRLRPGLSASVYLAYTLEPTQETTLIEPGNKAQSAPGPNELPQVFETAEKLNAHSRLNLIKPRMTQPHLFSNISATEEKRTIALQGLSSNLRINDILAMEFTSLETGISITEPYQVTSVTLDSALNQTLVALNFRGSAKSIGAISGPSLAKNLIATIEKYSDFEAFGLSDKLKTVKRVKELTAALQEKLTLQLPEEEGEVRSLAAREMPLLLDKLANEYVRSANPGHRNIADWLSGLKRELEEAQTTFLGSPSARPTLEKAQSQPAGVSSFVELFAPFKQAPSLQPLNEARLARQAGEIYAGTSEFVTQLFGALQPQAVPYVKAALNNSASVKVSVLSTKTVGLVELTGVQVVRQKAFLAGHSFPAIFVESTVGTSTVTSPVSLPTDEQYIKALGHSLSVGALNLLALDAEYDQIQQGDSIVVSRPPLFANENAVKGSVVSVHTVVAARSELLSLGSVSLQVTVLTLNPAWLPAQAVPARSTALVRGTTVYLQAEKLAHLERPIEAAIGPPEQDPTPLIELEGYYPSLEPGRWIILSGERVVEVKGTNTNTGVRMSELVMVASVQHEAKTLWKRELLAVKGEKLHTFIRPAQPPAYQYQRNTVVIYGNVVRATHGETRAEVLGSGDGSQTLQEFRLRQAPLTYSAAPTPSGAGSTLEVRVNDILWPEAVNLLALGSNDRGYITKADDAGVTAVVFGNGERGTRLPTGIENIKAAFRSGIGAPGNVRAGQIKLPMTKPMGVKGVLNPLPATGGADRESRNQARRNAPIATLALDRLVSVKDYADFARTFAGIAKADARALSDGTRQIVHLTIAGAGNIPIDKTSDLYRNLVGAVKRYGDPFQPFDVDVFERVLLVISGKVSLLPGYLWEKTKPKIRVALLDRFGFENRELGQDVPAGEVLSAMQGVPGVSFVDLDFLDSINEANLGIAGTSLRQRPRVNAEVARFDEINLKILPAQLVFLSADVVDTLILEEIPG